MLVVAVVVSLLLCLSLLLLASRWFRMWFALHKFSCPIGSPNYAASGWFRMWSCVHPGEPLTKFSCTIGSPN